MTWLKWLYPPPAWRPLVLILLGGLTGLAVYTAYISNAVSYLSDDPEACLNCHVMSGAYTTWQHGSHARTAVCNDCHVPHDNVFKKYFFKAQDGLRHASVFTMRAEPQVFTLNEGAVPVIQDNCIRCHTKVTEPVHPGIEGKTCWSCHRETPHGRVNSLSSSPYARIPSLSPVLSETVTRLIEQKPNETSNRNQP